MGSRGDVRNSSSENIGTYRNSRRVVTTISVRLGEFGRREEWFAIVSFLGEGCLSSGKIAGSVRTDAMETSRMNLSSVRTKSWMFESREKRVEYEGES